VALIVVNGIEYELSLEPDQSLLSVLREELGLTGAKYGCGEAECGACTVLVDGEPVPACTAPVGEVVGRTITTVEGLADDAGLNPVQRAFLEIGALQCGYCTPGMIVTASALLAKNPDPGEPQIRAALERNVCRCCTYPRILRAVRRAAELTRSPDERSPAGGASAGRPSVGGSPQETLVAHDGPWDLLSPEERDYFSVLSDGLVVVLPPGRTAPGMWSTTGGAWIHVGANTAITAFTGKVDVGQDNRTALCQLVAEELRASFEAVRLVMGDTDVCPFDMGTFGSRSMPDAGGDLRATAVAARELLVAMAAERWGVDPKELDASDARISEGVGDRSIAYGELLRGVRRVEIASGETPAGPGPQWRTAGEPTPNVSAPGIVTGAKQFPSDRTRPGMLHGRVLRPPAFGATIRSVDLADARAVPGVTAVHEGDFVGVAAPDPSTARRALQVVRAEWDRSPQPSERDLVEFLRSHPVEAEGWGGTFHHEAGDVDQALAEADVHLAETYTTAYVAHVPLEPRAALAEWAGERLTVWTGTQRPFGVRHDLAEALGVEEARVHVIAPDAGAGFGGKHTGEAAIEAARLARATGRPVKVMWSREEESTWGYVRPAAVIDVRSGAGADGALRAWEFTNLNSGVAGISCPYEIPNQRIAFQAAASPLRQGSYRALAATANHFARESHMDEVADRLGADPLEFRLRHTADERLAAVFRAAAERAGWAGRPGEPGHGMGIAGGVEKDARVATCVEVRVHSDGRLEILRIVTAFECGAIVNPDNLVNQIEGATVMGMGGALFEAVHFGDGRILNPRLSQYRVPRFSDVPPIDVVLIDRKDIASAGAGETPIVAVAPAIANAIFEATGRRIRSMPLVPDGVVR
jgi:nicotinate dehydrogenase subunit B